MFLKPSFDYQKKYKRKKKYIYYWALLFKMLKLRVFYIFYTEINVFVVTQRVKYQKKVPLGSGTEF